MMLHFLWGGRKLRHSVPIHNQEVLYNSHRKPEKKSEEKMFLEVTLFFQEELSTFVFPMFFLKELMKPAVQSTTAI